MKSQYNRELVTSMIAVCPPGSRDRNDELYRRLVTGGKSARDDLITSNMSLVLTIVDSYIACFITLDCLRDDLMSAGFMGLVKAVNSMADHTEATIRNPTGYVATSIHREIGKLIDDEPGVVKRRKEADDESAAVVVVAGASLPRVADSAPDHADLIALRDLIESCCETEEDRIIVRMREQGYVDREIAATLDLPLTTVYTMRRAIEGRYLSKCKACE